jgi:hypothetical protein
VPAVNALVSELALSIMRSINAAHDTPINLLATTLLTRAAHCPKARCFGSSTCT